MTDKLTVGVLGTGIMGAGMARSLARAGHSVRAWNRSRAKAEPLAADGIRIADSPAEAVRDADAVLTMLYDGGTVRQVIAEAAPGLRPGTVWSQSTTASPEDVAALAALAGQHGVICYDAPVLGTRQPAEAGQLTVLAAGPVAGRERITPVFDAIGARTVWTGDDTAAATSTRLKLVANGWLVTATNATGETLALCEALGVDPERFFEVIAGGTLDMPLLHAKTALLREGRLSPAQFAVSTAAKDARLIVAAGERHGLRLDLTAASAERFARAQAQGHGDEDMAAAYYASFDGRPPTAV
ncbi:NAD(P)-dependent oxidoreductase [Streptomyces sp. NPDC056716]|uniref:NAD(P)-dependent oxidoreductase n=1 Tax=unclassified Streptomyces TaxID=2593676 RepID=UPI0036D09FCC